MIILWFAHRDIKHPKAGGAERTIYEVGKRLTKLNIDVHLVTVNPGNLLNYENVDGIKTHRIKGNIGLPSMSIRNKEILVTGGAGFIGSNLVNTLSRENHVYALDDLQTGSVHNLDNSIGKVEFIKDKVKNINDYEINPDYIFHIGIYSSAHRLHREQG